jgi:hypothetical protein
MRWTMGILGAAALTVSGCALNYERTYLGTEIGGFQVAGFSEVGPPNSGPGYVGARNNEPVPMCVAWLSSNGVAGPYFRVQPGQDYYHPMRGALLSGLAVTSDLNKC